MALLVSKWSGYKVHTSSITSSIADGCEQRFDSLLLQLAFLYNSLFYKSSRYSFLNKIDISHFLAKITE